MEYRDELRQAIIGETTDDTPAAGRRWFKRGAKKAVKEPDSAPPTLEVEQQAEVVESARADPSDFKTRSSWGARSKDAAEPKPKGKDRENRKLRSAFSPLNILLRLAFAPVVAVSVALSLYIAGSPFAPDKALGHLVAMGGCESAAVVGLAPATAGSPGYHTPLDQDGDGVACTPADLAIDGPVLPGEGGAIQTNGAKFVRP